MTIQNTRNMTNHIEIVNTQMNSRGALQCKDDHSKLTTLNRLKRDHGPSQTRRERSTPRLCCCCCVLCVVCCVLCVVCCVLCVVCCVLCAVCCVLCAVCCVLRAACCVLRAACCVLRAAAAAGCCCCYPHSELQKAPCINYRKGPCMHCTLEAWTAQPDVQPIPWAHLRETTQLQNKRSPFLLMKSNILQSVAFHRLGIGCSQGSTPKTCTYIGLLVSRILFLPPSPEPLKLGVSPESREPASSGAATSKKLLTGKKRWWNNTTS